MKVKVPKRLQEKIVQKNLLEHIGYLEKYLDDYANGINHSIFHLDKNQDIVALEQHIAALKMVGKYFGAL